MDYISSWFSPAEPKETVYDQLLERSLSIANKVIDQVSPDIERRLSDAIDYVVKSDEYNSLTEERFADLVSDVVQGKFMKQDDDIVEFKRKFMMSKRYRRILGGSNKLRLMSIGPTQVGKSSTAKKLFGIPNRIMRIKKGIKSDTDKITEYPMELNDSELIYVDTPGFFDSRGKDRENLLKLINYLRKNKVHVILLFFKLGDMVDQKYIDLLHILTENLGNDIWDKTILVLTHANERAPEEYFYQEEEDLDFGGGELLDPTSAWINYTNEKKKMWQETIGKPDLPVVLIENNRYACNVSDGDFILQDGTPVWETFMRELFDLVSVKKAPVLFNLVIGEVTDIENEASTSTTYVPALATTNVTDTNNIPMQIVSEVKADTIARPISPVPAELTNRQKIASRAIEKSNKGEKKDGKWWCVIL